MTRNDSCPQGKISATVAPDGSLTIDAQPHEGMAKTMPWTLSLMLHAGVMLVLALATMIVPPAPKDTEEIGEIGPVGPASIDEPRGTYTPPPRGESLEGNLLTESRERVAPREVVAASSFERPGPKSKLAVLNGIGGFGGSTAGLTYGTRDGNGRRMIGIGGEPISHKAYNVVFLMDRSGSMLDDFDDVRQKLLDTIGHLRSDQSFHVVFFSSGKPVENPPNQLVPASVEYKQQAATFLQDVKPMGQTDPLPAVARAFDVLAGKKGGKIIFLLTDGAFPDNQKVLDLIQKRNADKGVTIITYLYGDRSKDATTVLQQIAKENHGKFVAIGQND